MPNKEQTLKTIQELVRVAETKSTMEEFLKAFKTAVDAIVAFKLQAVKDKEELRTTIEQELQKAVDSAESRLKVPVEESTKGLKDEVTSLVKDIKGQLNVLFNEQRNSLNFINDKVRGLKQAKDGETPTKEQLLALITPLIPKVTQPKDGVSPTEEQLLELITPLIPQIDDIVAKVPKPVQTPAKSFQIHKVDCTSQCDGANKSFTVGGSHFGIMGVYSTQFPIIYRPIIDYTETQTGFQLTAAVGAPESGQTLVAQFIK